MNLDAYRKSPLKAIRHHCLECHGWEGNGTRPVKAVRECKRDSCPLYSFRLGRNPFKRSGRGILVQQEKELLEAILF